MIRKFAILLIILLPSLIQGNQNYFFQDINQNYGLSNIGIMTMCEDENGFIWFGGMNGLYYHNTLAVEKVKLHTRETKMAKAMSILKIYKDQNNTIWICTPNGLFKYLRSQNTFEHKKLAYPNSRDAAISNIVQLNKHEYLLHKQNYILVFNELEDTVYATEECISKNISHLNKNKDGSIHIASSDGKVFEVQNNLDEIKLLYHSQKGRISSVCKDGNKYYIGHSHHGVDIINSNGFIINELNSTRSGINHQINDHISQIIRRENGEIWIGTNAGIYIHKNDELTLLDSQLETGLPHRIIYSMHQGYNQKVWVSTYSGGLACYAKNNYLFKHILLDYPQRQLDKSHVSSICEDSRGFIWIGSEDEGNIKVFDPEEMEFTNDLSVELQNNAVGIKTIIPISNEMIVYGINASNIITFYNYKKGTIEKQIELPLSKNTGVRGMQFLNGVVWAYDPHKITMYNIRKQKITKIYNSVARIWQLYIDSSHNVWVCTTNGLFIIKPGMENLEHCEFQPSAKALSEKSIYSTCEDMNGNIWVGTMGQGVYLYDPVKKELTPAPDHQLSADSDIYNLLKDKENNLWYITNKGLYRYNVRNNKTDYYGTNKGTLNSHNRLNASYVSSSGKLYFGAKSGFTIIDPYLIKKNTTVPSVYLANFKVNNNPYNSDSSLVQNALGLSQLKTIKLKASQNTLGFRVVSNNYIKSERNRFKYRLINYDDKWLEVPQNKDIVFTKVPPGSYIFEAYGSNNDHLWSEKPYRLAIKILPPYYSRWYALGLYGIVILTIGWLIYRELMTKIKLRKQIAEERYKTKANEQIHSERVKFFTNISHELRTPLSLIVSPISHILQKRTIDKDTKHLLNVVDRNAKRLQKIADQTIDFRLLEIGKLKPSFEHHELIQLAKDVFICFEQQLIDRQINFSFTSEFKHLQIVVDGDMIEKIIYNLLSNALKYTPEKESISLNICQRDISHKDYTTSVFTGHRFVGTAISISVKDTGPGIDKDLLPDVFERFTKGELAHQSSTGIGLHLCKEYSKMNKGNLQLTTKEGNGTSFTLNLPLKKDTHFEKGKQKHFIHYNLTESEKVHNSQAGYNTHTASILVVEDNSELRDLLKTHLREHFKIITAKSGEQAITQLENISPDLIITDVSMPGMSGIQLTKKLKRDPQFQNIPIIVMTAYADRSYQMESILNGADAFFTKPIDQTMLLAQVNNILKNKITTPVKTNTSQAKYSEPRFTEKAKVIVEQNLQNPNFHISNLLKELNISKSTLTRILKAETQKNASGFIRDIRLKKARTLLANNHFNIDEIASFVGFNYTSYFIKSFKNKYGLTPSEYRKKKIQ